ncbi:hypothetical protein MA16_Dca008147 [Dendrobium catenatum]|uniref:Uncharacterized protein n=1 Tax=Dendrobium catenatum TaxID=906689 RepID=A0A2I0X9X6_9ASPA|nr:hypothetical protein MA16_Dca008147 [Dendrobium catenatum]
MGGWGGSSGVGPSRQYWNQYDFQLGITTPAHQIDTQASQQDSLNTSGIQIPAWMNPFGLPHSPRQQDELLQHTQPTQITTDLGGQIRESMET